MINKLMVVASMIFVSITANAETYLTCAKADGSYDGAYALGSFNVMYDETKGVFLLNNQPVNADITEESISFRINMTFRETGAVMHADTVINRNTGNYMQVFSGKRSASNMGRFSTENASGSTEGRCWKTPKPTKKF